MQIFSIIPDAHGMVRYSKTNKVSLVRGRELQMEIFDPLSLTKSSPQLLPKSQPAQNPNLSVDK